MSRIPVFERTVLPDNAVGSAAIAAARAPGDQAAENLGKLRQGLEQGGRMAAEYGMREAAAENTTAVNSASIDFKMKAADMEQAWRDRRNGSPENFHKDFDTELTKLSDEYLKNAPSEAARVAMKDNLDRQRAGAYESNQVWERTRKVELFGASVEKATDDLGRLAYTRGQKGQDTSDLYRDADATTIAGSTFIAPEKIDKLNRSIRETITEGRLKGLAVSDPGAAMKELQGMATQHDSFGQADSFVAREEGGYADNDGGTGAPVNFGINQKANPDIDVKTLTPEKAQEIRKTRYWDVIGADKMSPSFASVAYDGAINQGAGWINSVKDAAQGDPIKLLDMREQRYREIAKANPAKAKYLNGWLDRLDRLRAQVKTQAAFQPPEATPENTPGMTQTGNIDLMARPVVKNEDGSVSTVRSISIGVDGHEVLIPTVSEDGKIMTPDEAKDLYLKTGKNLGTFDSPEAATAYAQVLHEQQAATYAPQDDGINNLSYEKIVTLRTSIQAEQERQIKLRNEDPVAYLQSKGDLTNQPLNLANPEMAALQIRQRADAVQKNATNYGGSMSVFNKSEATYYAQRLDQMPTTQRLGMLNQLRETISSPRVYRDTLNAIRPDSPVQAMAGMYLGLPQDSKIKAGDAVVTPYQVAQNILVGEDLLNPVKADKTSNGTGKVFPMPKDGDDNSMGLRAEFSSFTGNAFGGRPEEYAQAYQAFRAYYAAESSKAGDYSGVIDSSRARAAAQAVTGGIADKNDQSYILPWGMDEDVFVDAAEDNFQAMKTQFPKFFSSVDWDDVKLENTGEPGRYRMIVGAGYLHDAGGIPLTLKMGR